MSDITRVLAASATEAFNVTGNYIHVRSADRTFRIRFADGSSAKLEQGDQIHPAGGFAWFEVENIDAANALNIELIAGVGAFKQGQLVGTIDAIVSDVKVVNGATPFEVVNGATPFDIGSITNPVTVTPNDVAPIDLSVCTPYFINGSGTTLITIVAPASNVNGIRVKKLEGDSANNFRFMAKASAPSSWMDAAAHTIWNGVANLQAFLPRDVLIPAGMGLYLQNSNTGTFYLACEYELL